MKISTLGPENTNSQFASEHYLTSRSQSPDGVVLFDTPEQAIDELIAGRVDKTILCIVYPPLNEIVFKNLTKIKIEEVFKHSTDHMIVASRKDAGVLKTGCSHPAPEGLLKGYAEEVTLVNSNSLAARLVDSGEYDACVTTLSAANMYDLKTVEDFGPVPMGWAVFERA